MNAPIHPPLAALSLGPDPATQALIDTVARHADADQARWLAGYFTGLADALARGAPGVSGLAAAPVPAHAPTRTLTILVGSETGNARALAKALAAAAAPLNPTIHEMGKVTAKQLKALEDVLIICSTYGEGDPPHPAIPFFEMIEGGRAPKLDGVRFGVLALGDSSYNLFCEAGRRLDQRFAELGATRLIDRVDCDLDFDAPAQDWTDRAVAALTPDAASTPPSSTVAFAQAIATSAASSAPVYDRKNPFPATVLAVQRIVGRGSTKDVRHIELDLDGSGLTYAPGAALSVVPTNAPDFVDAVAEALALPDDARETLAHRYDITTVTPRFIDGWRALARLGDDAVAAITPDTDHIIDVVRRHPVQGVTPDQLYPLLRPLTPRAYSIASSQALVGDEAHLTVAPVRYTLHGTDRHGVASVQLSDRLAVGDSVPIFIQDNPNFALPDPDAPIIMIGPGTGVAPFRAFLQERAESGATGRNWLVFGDRNFRSDFLYQAEWHDWRERGVLTRIDVAFSRDRHNRAYVQDRLLQNAEEVAAWIKDGAHVYVCGDAARMAPDVEKVLADIAGADWLHSGHYHRDVY